MAGQKRGLFPRAEESDGREKFCVGIPWDRAQSRERRASAFSAMGEMGRDGECVRLQTRSEPTIETCECCVGWSFESVLASR